MQNLVFGTHTPLTAASTLTKSKVCADHPVRQERCAHTTKNRTEVLCPRVTQAAMIAAASFGLRRSGRLRRQHRERPMGRISEAWPALAPPGECYLSPSFKIRSNTGPRTQWSPPSCGEGLGWGVVSCGSRLVHYSHRAKHLGLLPPLAG